MKRLRLLPLVASILVMGCQGSDTAKETPPSFPSMPVQTLTLSSGLHVDVFTSPSPPTRGVNAVEYLVTDADGGTVEGATLDVTPWMPAMGHGTSVTPTVKAVGNGRYDITNVDFFMPGLWELRSKLSGNVTDETDPQFQIP